MFLMISYLDLKSKLKIIIIIIEIKQMFGRRVIVLDSFGAIIPTIIYTNLFINLIIVGN